MSNTTNGSTGGTSDEDRKIIAVAGNAANRSSGRFGASVGMPTERSNDFGAALRRLGELLAGERLRLIGVLILSLSSVTLVVLGPRLLGQATDIIVRGVVGGSGIDFGDLHRKLWFILGIYTGSWALSHVQAFILAGVVQRSMYALRAQVEQKLNRLPLRYVDSQPRGDLLSRVTNDIDNLAQSLQQTMSQILTSTLLLIGVAVMMVTISPFMAAVALVTVPGALWLMKLIGGRARPRFMDQWRHTGSLNAQEIGRAHV